jgi:hypothetical protein
MTLHRYLSKFGIILGTLQLLFGALPFIGKAFNIGYISPPVNIRYFILYALFFVTVIFVTYFLKNMRIWKKSWGAPLAIGIMFLIALGAFFSYAYWYEKAVRPIYIESLKETEFVIIGTERSDAANTEYPDLTEIEILRKEGHREVEIRKFWTPASLIRSRLFILSSYFIMLLALTEIFSIGVLKSLLDEEK